MVMFWKENSGHQPQLIIPETDGRDETNSPSPPSDFQFFDDPDVPFAPQIPPPPEAPAPPRRRAPPEQSGPLGHPPGCPPAPSPACDREVVRTRYILRERLQPRSSPRESQLVPIPMNDGDDDQPLHPHAQVSQVPQIQPMVTTTEPDDVSDDDFTDVNPSSPSARPPPLAEQRRRSRSQGRS